MAMAAIDAPHILILDEPTNHLDIESREALVHALNDYQGAVILVSHDPHLVETVADTLWIVRDGRVSLSRVIWTTTSACCSRNAAARRPRQAMVPTPPHRRPNDQRSRRLHERAPSRHKTAASGGEQVRARNVDLQTRKDRLQTMMARPGFYDSKSAEEIAEIGQEMANISEQLASAEEVWLEAQEALEQAWSIVPTRPVTGCANLRISSIKSSGCSIAAKWPPCGISVHCVML